MPFVSHDPRSGKGGKRANSGRKPIKVIADRALATKLAEEKLSRGFGKLIETAFKLARGIPRRKFFPKDYELKKGEKRFYYEREYDSAMIRFLSERYVPPAKVSVDVNLTSGFEALIADLEKEELLEKQRIEAAIDVTAEWEEPVKDDDDKKEK